MTARDHRELMYVRSLARKIDRSLKALEIRLAQELTTDARSDKMAVIDGIVEGVSGARPGLGLSVAEPTQLLMEDEDGYPADLSDGSERIAGSW